MSTASSSATARVGTTRPDARRAARAIIDRCQLTPRAVSVSGWVHGTVSCTVTLSVFPAGARGGANGVGACTASPPGHQRRPSCHAATSARGGIRSTRGPSTPSSRAASTSACRATALDTVQPGGADFASAGSSSAV